MRWKDTTQNLTYSWTKISQAKDPPPPVLVKPRALFVENKAEAKNDHTKCEYRVQIFMSKPVYNSHDVLEGQRLRQAEK